MSTITLQNITLDNRRVESHECANWEHGSEMTGEVHKELYTKESKDIHMVKEFDV